MLVGEMVSKIDESLDILKDLVNTFRIWYFDLMHELYEIHGLYEIHIIG